MSLSPSLNGSLLLGHKYIVHLNEFEGVIKSCWKELERENYLCDVTLSCEERQIKTHK